VRVPLSVVLAFVVLILAAAPAGAEIELPRGFTMHLYVTGEGFDSTTSRNVRGLPSATTLAFDADGNLYVARSGRRYMGGEIEDIWPIYRFPVGGARVTPKTERSFLHGPPLPNPQIAAVRAGRDVFVTTFDRERRIGVLYRIADGRAELVAGGTPDAGKTPLLRQPEGAAADTNGNLYVADRAQAVIAQFDPRGRLVDPKWFAVLRPRVLAIDSGNRLWIGADGAAEAPWQRGPGEIWRVQPDGTGTLVLRGPVSSGLVLGPGDVPFVADRQAGKIFLVTSDSRRIDFATYTDGDAPRGLVFAPDTPATRAAGIAGDLFVITIQNGAWPVNSVMRISGPFEEFVRKSIAE
jgi:sugar lactone lactonase YvrE